MTDEDGPPRRNGSTPSYLGRDAILNADDLPREEVDCPEWGGVVLVRGMTGTERDNFEASMIANRGEGTVELNMANSRARAAATCIINHEGVALFSLADTTNLGMKSAKALDRVFTAVLKLSGMTKEEAESLAGNSESETAGISPSS